MFDLSNLDTEDLRHPELTGELSDAIQLSNLDELGRELVARLPHVYLYAGGANTLWSSFTHEIRLLLCSDSKKYTGSRRQLNEAYAHGTTAFVSSVATVLSSHLLVQSTVLAPMVSLTLLAIARAGKDAYCHQSRCDETRK